MKKIILMAAMAFALFGFTVCLAESPKPFCKSKYQFPVECVSCHIPPTGEVGDILPETVKKYNDIVYLYVERIDFQNLRDRLLAIKRYPIKKIVIDLYSFGGSIFDAMAMAALISEQCTDGRIIEIRARGLVASAGLIVMISGTKGHRYLDRNSMVMFHELSTAKWFSNETPTDKEEETKILRMIQNKINAFISSRSKISEQELCEKIKKKEFWMDAETAIRYGFADQIIN